MSELYVGKSYRETRTKLISDSYELYRFLDTPVILLFPSDNVV